MRHLGMLSWTTIYHLGIVLPVLTCAWPCKTIAASLNPVPIFSSSKGLMSVIALYPNSSLPTAREPDGGSTRTSLEARNLLNYEYADSHDLEKRGGQRTYWNDACACYRTRLHPHSDEYDATTYTTTTATGLISFKPEPSRKPPKPEPTTTNPPKKSEEMQVDPGAFAGLFLGITGACLQRRSGVLVCTSNSLWVWNVCPNECRGYEHHHWYHNIITYSLPILLVFSFRQLTQISWNLWSSRSSK